MAEFAYKVLDKTGKSRSGKIEADNEAVAIARIREKGWTPVSLSGKKARGLPTGLRIPGLSDRVDLKSIAVSSRQLATMINAGLPLLRALTVLADQTESKALAKTWVAVRDDVQTGSSFSAALGKHPKAFNRLYVSMVRAGEAGGVLDDVLLRVADTLEKQVALRQKVKSAMTYPVMVAGMVFLILIAILLFVVPTFETLYADLGGVLPLPTRLLLAMSAIVQRFLPLVIVAMAVGLFLIKKSISTERGRLYFDTLKLKIPVFGELFKKVAMARFSRTLGALLRSGVPVLQSIEITQDTVGNRVVSDALKDVHSAVREGETLARPLERHKVFPPMVVQMLAVGEETGTVDTMLDKVANFYDGEVEATVEALTSLIEPLMIAGLGAVVGGILISLYLPMFRLIDIIQ